MWVGRVERGECERKSWIESKVKTVPRVVLNGDSELVDAFHRPLNKH